MRRESRAGILSKCENGAAERLIAAYGADVKLPDLRVTSPTAPGRARSASATGGEVRGALASMPIPPAEAAPPH
jgi:hypothetical protein